MADVISIEEARKLKEQQAKRPSPEAIKKKIQEVTHPITKEEKNFLDSEYDKAFSLSNLSFWDEIANFVTKYGEKFSYAINKAMNYSWIDMWPVSFQDRFYDLLYNLDINSKLEYFKEVQGNEKRLFFVYNFDEIAKSISDNVAIDKENYGIDETELLVTYLSATFSNIIDNNKKLGKLCDYGFHNAVIDEGFTTDFGQMDLNFHYRDKIYTRNPDWVETLYSSVRNEMIRSNGLVLPKTFDSFAGSLLDDYVEKDSKLFYNNFKQALMVIDYEDLDEKEKEVYDGPTAKLRNFIELGKKCALEREKVMENSSFTDEYEDSDDYETAPITK